MPCSGIQYTVGGITRSRHAGAAKELEANGVQVVEVDASDEGSLRNEFAGSQFVFGITDYGRHTLPMDPRPRRMLRLNMEATSSELPRRRRR